MIEREKNNELFAFICDASRVCFELATLLCKFVWTAYAIT